MSVGRDVQAELEAEQRFEDLRAAHERTLRKMEQMKRSKDELVEAVYRAVADAHVGLKAPSVPAPAKVKKTKAKTAEYAVAVLSDWQLAKITPTYNSEICEQRIEEYGDKVLELAEIQRADHPVTDLRVWILGDIVEGELIFPGQQHLIDSSLYRQVTVDGPRILRNFLRKMLANFENVHVTAVIGNHGAIGGRARRDYDPETNADRMLYRIVQQLMEDEKRLTWNIPDGANDRHWYAVDKVGAKSALLFHGDQVRGGFAGYPWYGFGKKVLGWGVGAIEEHFDYAVCGHWHQPTSFVLNTKLVYCNGSTESTNTYAMEQLAAVGFPCQWLFFMHPERGITAEYRVWLS
jgi:predicted phosphodiesterase